MSNMTHTPTRAPGVVVLPCPPAGTKMRCQLFVEKTEFFNSTKTPAGSLSVVVFATPREAPTPLYFEAGPPSRQLNDSSLAH